LYLKIKLYKIQMPKKQETTSRDINYAIRDIYKILCEIQYEECEKILEIAWGDRRKERGLDVDESESEEEESEGEKEDYFEFTDDSSSCCSEVGS